MVRDQFPRWWGPCSWSHPPAPLPFPHHPPSPPRLPKHLHSWNPSNRAPGTGKENLLRMDGICREKRNRGCCALASIYLELRWWVNKLRICTQNVHCIQDLEPANPVLVLVPESSLFALARLRASHLISSAYQPNKSHSRLILGPIPSATCRTFPTHLPSALEQTSEWGTLSGISH